MDKFKNLSRVLGAALLLGLAFTTAQQYGCINPPQPNPPQPDPQPQPEPEPEPQDSPIPVPGLKVLIIDETSARSRMPSKQLMILTDKTWQDYVTSKGGQWLIIDKDAEFIDSNSIWRTAIQRPRQGVPWAIVSNYPHGGWEGPLPNDKTGMLELVKKWGEK